MADAESCHGSDGAVHVNGSIHVCPHTRRVLQCVVQGADLSPGGCMADTDINVVTQSLPNAKRILMAQRFNELRH